MASKNLTSYRKLAASRGYPDPMTYVFGRLKVEVKEGRHENALEIAKFLIPYGHGKIAPIDGDTGITAQSVIFQLD